MPSPAIPPQGGPAPVLPAVFTRTSLAAYLSRSEAAFDRDNAAGNIPAPCGRLNRSPRWLRSEIDAWLACGMPPRQEWEALRDAEAKRAATESRR